MTRHQFTQPIFIENPNEPNNAKLLERVSLSDSHYDEAWLQELLFNNPRALPIPEIDASFMDLIPVCMELNTDAGPLDILFVNQQGMLTIVECKLWRNPEARRKVVGQILDYAKELSRWSYEDLMRETSKALKQPGDRLIAAVKARHADLDEAQFIDNVSRNMKMGRFLLLIAGDGIREGTERIIEFLDGNAGLHFTFGLVELQLNRFKDDAIFIQPRTLARTVIATRNVIEIRSGEGFLQEDTAVIEDETQELSENAARNFAFWTKLFDGLHFDDPAQSKSKPSKQSTQWLPSICKPIRIWVTAKRSKADNAVSVIVTNETTSQKGFEFMASLKAHLPEIQQAFEDDLFWIEEEGRILVGVKKAYDDIYASNTQEAQIHWLRDQLNRCVNAFRPRAAKFVDDYDA